MFSRKLLIKYHTSFLSCIARHGLVYVTCSTTAGVEVHTKKGVHTTCVLPPDLRGGFELHNAEEVEKEGHLLDELGKLSVSGPRGTRERPPLSRCFTPLLDIPVDGYNTESRDLRPPPASPMPPNWLLAHSQDPRPPLRTDIGTIRSVHFHEVSDTASERGRSPLRDGHSKGRKENSGDRSEDGVFTLQSAARRTRPSLAQVFRPSPDRMNGLHGSEPELDYELKTVSISKTKQSLGK